jgi:hypothetical protein
MQGRGAMPFTWTIECVILIGDCPDAGLRKAGHAMLHDLKALIARVEALTGPDAEADGMIRAFASALGSPRKELEELKDWPAQFRSDYTAHNEAGMALAVYFDLPWLPVMQQAAQDSQWPRTIEDDRDINAIPPWRFTLAILRAKLAGMEGSV